MVFQTHARSDLARFGEGIADHVAQRAMVAMMQADPAAAAEMAEIYLPLSRLIHTRLRGDPPQPDQAPFGLPFIIGLTGSVAVGKSSAAKLLQQALAAWPEHPEVALVNSDGFLYPNRILKERGLMERKGFPETYDHAAIAEFLMRLKTGAKEVMVPVYSHVLYDVLDADAFTLRSPQIIILEGITVLQRDRANTRNDPVNTPDLIDFSIYLHADEAVIKKWFTERFMALTAAAAGNPQSFYQRFAPMTEQERQAVVDYVWSEINGKNLNENILPRMAQADLILHKDPDHKITHYELRN